MAFSVLQQYPNFMDLQTCFDTFPLQRTINDCLGLIDPTDPMEYNASGDSNGVHHHHQPIINNNNSRSNSSSHSDNIEGSDVGNSNNNFPTTTTNTTESINNTTIRSCLGGFHHQSISNDYEQVINFVDSPPNSEGSWQDEQSKASPGPQIIEVQTIYSNSGARKRRMDWDSLDIGQNGSTTTVHTVDIANNKIPHLSGGTNSSNSTNSVQQQNDKEKHKKDKQPSGRGSWADDIEFDLNAEFNSNSYLNNETFLSFSTTLTVPKQEPQTELPKENKSAIVCVANVAEAAKEADGISCDEQKPEQSAICDKEEDVVAFASPRPQHGSMVETAAATSLSDEHKFQYILAAATSIATKNNEETLTYLNQGQSYEIKLKKTGDLSFYRDKILKSVIKICFHERRLQYMEREQMQQWKASRPGERIIEVDVPLSYGLCHVSQPLTPNFLNTVEVFWDPLKEVGVYVKVNCISTEFTPRKHGGEKGVPFKLQIETYIENTNTAAAISPTTIIAATTAAAPLSPTPTAATSVTSVPAASPPTFPASFGSAYNNVGALRPTQAAGKQPVHAAACQIKVFKLKGADRKHKQDREKIQKRSQSEQEKFQPSYECTIMNDMPLDVVVPTSGRYSPEFMKVWPNSPVHIPKYDGTLAYGSTSPPSNSSPIAINSVTSSNSPTLKMMDPNLVSSQQGSSDMDDNAMNIMPETTPAQVSQWLTYHRLTPYLSTFAHFSGADIMRMSKDDLIQICGLADGIRMYNILRAKAIAPRLTLYLSTDGNNFSAIYLLTNTAKELSQKIYKVPGLYDVLMNGSSMTMNGSVENAIVYNSWGGGMHSKYSNSGTNIFNDVTKASIYVSGPSGVHVNVTDEVLTNEIKDGSLYALEVQNDKVIMKLINK